VRTNKGTPDDSSAAQKDCRCDHLLVAGCLLCVGRTQTSLYTHIVFVRLSRLLPAMLHPCMSTHTTPHCDCDKSD
jgi:hypothetical protein